MTDKGGNLVRYLATVLSLLIAFGTVVSFAVRADNRAQAAMDRTADQETRIRALERSLADMAGDIRVIRVLLERDKQSAGPTARSERTAPGGGT